jgi:hypothetical protein
MSDPVTKFDLDRALKQRDLVFLSDQISNENLSPEVRSHLAGIIRGLLTGDVKIPNHRPTKSHSGKKTWKIALRVVELRRSGEWDKVGAAVRKVAEEFRCSETKVWGCLKQFRDYPRELEITEWHNWYDWRQREEERREEERREEERREEERREEEWREQRNEAEAYLVETKGDRDYTDKEIEDAMAILESERRHYK